MRRMRLACQTSAYEWTISLDKASQKGGVSDGVRSELDTHKRSAPDSPAREWAARSVSRTGRYSHT